MKQLITIAVLLFCSPVFSQVPIKKVHGYFRIISPGILRVRTDEKGNIIEQPPLVKTEYFIYLECYGKQKPVLSSLIIDGREFGTRLDSVKTTPVILLSDPASAANRYDTLVNKTSLTVWRLIPVAIASKQKQESPPKHIISISYQPRAGKEVVTISRQLEGLVPVAMP